VPANSLMTAALVLACVLAAAYGAVFLALYGLQRSMIFKPDRAVPSRHAAGLEAMDEVVLRTADGLDLGAWYSPPRPGRPTVLYFHGNAGNRGWLAHKALPYLEAGYGVLLPDYRGYGGNAGAPTEDGLRADARAALDFVRGQGASTGDVIYHGESLGSGVAAWLASVEPPRALVMEAAFTSMPAVAALQYPWLPTRLAVRDRFTSVRRIRSITVPTLFVHGVNDTLVPVDHARTLFQASAARVKDLVLLPGGLHADLYDHGAGALILDWLTGLQDH